MEKYIKIHILIRPIPSTIAFLLLFYKEEMVTTHLLKPTDGDAERSMASCVEPLFFLFHFPLSHSRVCGKRIKGECCLYCSSFSSFWHFCFSRIAGTEKDVTRFTVASAEKVNILPAIIIWWPFFLFFNYYHFHFHLFAFLHSYLRETPMEVLFCGIYYNI